jgi:hypothetical protein
MFGGGPLLSAEFRKACSEPNFAMSATVSRGTGTEPGGHVLLSAPETADIVALAFGVNTLWRVPFIPGTADV